MSKTILFRMHIWGHFLFSNYFKLKGRAAHLLALLCLGLLSTRPAHAQAPGLLWQTNMIGASVVAVDGLTNVYASTNGTVITLNSAGVPFQTNVLSDLPGRAQRDTAGNLYFAGVRPAFNTGGGGGGIFDYGSTNACFLAKYTSAGTLIWSNGFGPIGSLRGIKVKDVQVDTNGDVYAGFTYNVTTSDHISSAARFDASGSNTWTSAMPKSNRIYSTSKRSHSFGKYFSNQRIRNHICGTITCFQWAITLSRFDSNGTADGHRIGHRLTEIYYATACPGFGK